MPQPILRFKIFISCPGDVEAEKDRLFEFFRSAETALTKKGIPGNLVPLYWKNIVHQYDGVRGQTVINKEFDEYDHYIGILAARFGTPTTTEAGITYGSGTEEEFRIAVGKKNANGELGLYFFFKNVAEPTELNQKEEYNRVIKFKRELYPNGWVNAFNDPVNLSDKLNEDLIPIIEETIRRNQSKIVSSYVAESTFKEVDTSEGPTTVLNTLTDDIPVVEIKHPLARTVTVEGDDDFIRMIFSEDYKKELVQLINDQNRIVLLGNAGSGKSTELAKLVDFYQKPGSLFIPVFSKLNTYIGGRIDAFLPQEFQNVPENAALVVLDGLDEVENEYFNEALSEIVNFADEFPLSKIVLSCRTNFFELSVGANKGYLQDFAITRINEITHAAIVQTMNDNGLDGEAFFREVLNCEYQDIITKPFFLNILSSVYQKQKHLRGGRNKVFAEAIRLKIEAASEKENLSEKEIERCEKLLVRLGLIMEFLGRNYLSDAEFVDVIASDADRTMLEKSSLVIPAKGRWSFEHNNIQEYYAARALSPLGVDQIKTMVAFYPDFKKIKPSWVNTLSFLISIAADEKREQLLNWIIENEPETIIRFEADRIDPKIRFRVFSAIFRDFQDNGLAIRSNKFTEAELGHFGDTPESLAILKEAITRIGNNVNNKITAIRLLEFFKLGSDDEKQDVKNLILDFIYQNEDKAEAVYSAVHVLVRCKLADQETVEQLVDRYRDREEPYYRATLYTLITKTDNVDQYVSVFIEGITLIGKRSPDLQKNTLWNETAQLKRGLEALKEPDAINTALGFFAEPYDERYRLYSDKKDILDSLIRQAIHLYPDAQGLYDCVFLLFINYGRTLERDILAQIRSFFEQTGTLVKAVKTVFEMADLTKFQKHHSLSMLLNADSIEFIISEVNAGHIPIEDVQNFAEEAFYHTRNTAYAKAVSEFKEQLINKFQLSFNDSLIEARQAKHRQNEQDSFNLLFDENAMKAETERFWLAFGKDHGTWAEIWDFSYSAENNQDHNFPQSVITFISELTRNRNQVSKSDVEAFMQNTERFEIERVDSIYNSIRNSGMKVNNEQRTFLENWSNRIADRIDIKKSISADGEFNKLSLIIWYYIKTLQIKLPADKLLDFTLFYDFSQGSIQDWSSPILEHVAEPELNARIIENLKSGIVQENIWSLNAEYAIEKGLTESFPAIKSDLARIQEITSVKENITKIYLEKTDDQEGLYEVLLSLQPQDFRWRLVDILVKGRLKDNIQNYLRSILESDAERDEKLHAAKRLTALADEVGFNYYADHGFDNRDVFYRDSISLSYLANLKTLNFLPRLIQLLEQSLAPENTRDLFTRYDSKILEALFNMGIQSEENLEAVTAAARKIIAKSAPELNYLIPWLKQMDFQFKLNLSSEISLEAAIVAVNAIGYL